jgi:ribosome-binding protein aMBF1 (putative translation factor)
VPWRGLRYLERLSLQGRDLKQYPKAQRAIADVIKTEREAQGLSKRGLSERLEEDRNHIRLIESLQRDVSVAEFIAIAQALGKRPSTLLARIERILKA